MLRFWKKLFIGNLRLFGDDGDNETTSTNTTLNYSPEEAARRTQVMDEAARLYRQTPISQYPGATPVPFSQASQQAQQMAMSNAQNAQGTVDAINNGVNYGLTTAMDVDNNPYLQKAIQSAQRGITQQYTDAGGVLSNIRTDANNAGQLGSSRQGVAEGIAAGRYADALGDVATNMSNSAYDMGQQTFQKTLQFAPQAMDASMKPVEWMSGVGAQQENLAQEYANYDAAQREWAINAPWINLNNYASMVYGNGPAGTTSTSSNSGSGRSGLTAGQAAGGALTAASMYNMMNNWNS